MRARSAAASVVRHVGGVAAEATLVAALVATVALALSPVYAPAKFVSDTGKAEAASKNSYSITLVVTVGAAPTAVTYGSSVTTLSVYGSVDPDYARVSCVANSSTITTLGQGVAVYDVFKTIRQGTWNTGGYASFVLSSPAWTGGGADCTASLMTYVMHKADRIWKTLATTTFSALP